MKQIRFGVVGIGEMARKHMNILKSSKDTELVGVFSHDRNQAMSCSNKYGINFYPSYGDMLSDKRIDVIDIATYNHLHAEYGIKAMEEGKHVLVEKPIDISITKARKFLMAAERRKRILSCVSQFVFAPDIARLKKIIEQGSLGRICLVRAEMQLHKGNEYYAGWRAKKRYAGGGIVIMNLIHLIDVFNYLFGDIQDLEAFLKTTREGIEVEDCAILFLKYPKDIPCVVTATNAASQDRPMTIEVQGTNKTLRLENFSFPGIKSLLSRKYILENCLRAQVQDMVKAVKFNKQPFTDGKRALQNLKTIHKIYDTARVL